MRGTAAELLAWADAQRGVTERPAGSNRVRYWDDCGMHGDQGEPWCATFYLAGLLAVGVTPVTRSVFVPTIENDYRRAGRWYPIERAQPGDQVCYGIGKGHTGVVVSIDARARTLVAVEGNTSGNDHDSQDNGGGVFRKVRPWSLVHGVGRPPFQLEHPEVKPMHDPAWMFEPIVADRPCPTGGAWLLGVSGAIYAVGGAPYHGGANGKPYFANRTAADFAELTPAETAAGKSYVILSRQAGGRYAYPE